MTQYASVHDLRPWRTVLRTAVGADYPPEHEPMEHPPHLDSIKLRLHRALPHFLALPGIGQQVSGDRQSSAQLERAVKNLLERKDEWFAAVPAFRDVHDWVEAHWDTERQTQPPAGTVSTGDVEGHLGELQLDALTATCKLLLATAVHGTAIVANCAVEFAAHGMIDVRSFYLLKGLPVSNPEPLDDHCTLLPYREALQAVRAASGEQLSEQDLHWPPAGVDNVSVLEVRSFERRSLTANRVERRESRLLQCGPETLTLVLGLVWGRGFRVFGNWHGVAEPVAATLPFFHANAPRGWGSRPALLTGLGFGRRSTSRPLNGAELVELIGTYPDLPQQAQRVLSLALRRLRDGTERIELEDRVIDVSIALEALFMEDGEDWDQKKIVSRRASWYFADSHPEREHIRCVLKDFYDQRSAIVHGNTPANLTWAEEGQLATLTADIENVARSSLKDMISAGRPQNWEDSKDPKLIRHDPPRRETEILSVKSDSMSWTVAEQKEIDHALEAIWKPDVDSAPPQPPDAVSSVYTGVIAEEIERCRQQGIPYVISVPIRLYWAHPRWPKQEGDFVDDRTKYYCEKDVERHLRRWQEAAAKKKLYQFTLEPEDPKMYLPKSFDMWRTILRPAGLP